MGTKILLISFLLIIAGGRLYPQEKQLYGFSDLDWNSSKETVKDYMKNKYDLLPGYEKEDAIGYQGGSYLNENLDLWVYFFNHKGLEEVDLVIKSDSNSTGGIFFEVVHNLSEEYGDPDLYKKDEWTAEWFYYDFPGKHLNAAIKVAPYSSDELTRIKISFLHVE